MIAYYLEIALYTQGNFLLDSTSLMWKHRLLVLYIKFEMGLEIYKYFFRSEFNYIQCCFIHFSYIFGCLYSCQSSHFCIFVLHLLFMILFLRSDLRMQHRLPCNLQSSFLSICFLDSFMHHHICFLFYNLTHRLLTNFLHILFLWIFVLTILWQKNILGGLEFLIYFH